MNFKPSDFRPYEGIVYKYIDERGAKLTLQDKRFKVSTADSVNDPFDCVPVLKSSTLSENEISSMVSKKIGFVSFSKIPPEDDKSILLWSHYTGSHRGCSLGFDFTKYGLINRNLAAAKDGTIRVVTPYLINSVEDRFIVDGALTKEQIDILPLVKAKCWSYEEEVRIVYVIGTFEESLKRYREMKDRGRAEKLESFLVDTHDFTLAKKYNSFSELYTVAFPIECLVSIHFGCMASDKFKQEVKQWVKENNLQIELIEFKADSKKFGFTQKKIVI